MAGGHICSTIVVGSGLSVSSGHPLVDERERISSALGMEEGNGLQDFE